jgi:hypothetical protein
MTRTEGLSAVVKSDQDIADLRARNIATMASESSSRERVARLEGAAHNAIRK